MNNRISILICALLVPTMLLLGSTIGVAQNLSAPDLSMTDINGQAVKLSEYKDKVIVLNFFASWCPPCKQEIPDFISLQEQYKDKGLVMIGVAISSPDEVKKLAQKLGINYTVLLGTDSTTSAYGPLRSIPTTFIIDKDFKIAKKYIGLRSRDVFEKDIKDLLSK